MHVRSETCFVNVKPKINQSITQSINQKVFRYWVEYSKHVTHLNKQAAVLKCREARAQQPTILGLMSFNVLVGMQTPILQQKKALFFVVFVGHSIPIIKKKNRNKDFTSDFY